MKKLEFPLDVPNIRNYQKMITISSIWETPKLHNDDFSQNIAILTDIPLSLYPFLYISLSHYFNVFSILLTILLDLNEAWQQSPWMATVWEGGIDMLEVRIEGQWRHKNLKKLSKNP